MMPVSLAEIISIKETTTEIIKEAKGPKRKPPMTIMTSLGSYFRKSTTGTRPTTIRA